MRDHVEYPDQTSLLHMSVTPKLSVVIPVYNEEPGLAELFSRLKLFAQ